MRPKILFWLAVAMAVIGVHSPEGNLFYFLAVHSSMLLIATLLQRREKRGRRSASVGVSSPQPMTAAAKAKAR
jgi:hypothetical protein